MSLGDRLRALADATDVEALERQLADLAAPDSEAADVLARLAEAVFPDRVDIGDPARILWPEPRRATGPGPAAGTGPAAGPGPEVTRRMSIGALGPREDLEAQIRQSEARFRSLVEQLPAMVFYAALGAEENEVYVSPQIEQLLGFTQEEWLTNPLLWYSQLHPDDHETVIEAFTRGVQTGAPFRATVRFISRSGEEVWILGEARLIRDEAQRPAYFQGVAFDITMTKRAQEAIALAERAKADAAQLRADAFATHNIRLRQLNQELRAAKDAAEEAAHARSTFLTTMSHELRTPLNSVIVLAGLMADEDLTAPQRDMVRRMRLASDHLLALINDVLEFSRLRAGQVELDYQTFELVPWVNDTIEIVAPRAAEKGLVLRLVVADGVPRTLTGDQGRLRQVLLNLLANAIKFTAAGFVEVRLAAQPSVDGRWEFQCSVADSGIGIRPEDTAALFDEFRQADSGIAREFGGTGLGLAICKRLCDLLGGRIWVEDTDGLGATIVFTWLCQARSEEVTTAGSRLAFGPGLATSPGPGPTGLPVRPDGGDGNGAARAMPRGRLRILVAEDNLMNQQVVLLLLGAMGYDADVVGDGDAAIAAVRTARYDVVLMDVAMPGTDGLSATRLIRSLGAEVHQPYVVALTAHAFPGDADTCLEAGMDDYVAKPIDRGQLARALEAGARAAHEPDGVAGRSVTGQNVTGQNVTGQNVTGHSPTGHSPTGQPPERRRPPEPRWMDPRPSAPAPRLPAAGRPEDDGFDPLLPLDLLHQFGPKPFRELVTIFRTEATRLVASAQAAVETDDVEQAERAAHALKSSAANLGARGLYETCSRLEALARSGTLKAGQDLGGTMAGQLADALGRLDAMVAPDGS